MSHSSIFVTKEDQLYVSVNQSDPDHPFVVVHIGSTTIMFQEFGVEAAAVLLKIEDQCRLAVEKLTARQSVGYGPADAL